MESFARRRARPRGRFARPFAGLLLGWLGLGLPVAPAAQSVDAVLVTPFTNLSRQAPDAWIGAGIAETVSSDLRNLGLSVVGDRALGARWLVDGGYQRVGDLLRITARIVDVATGEVRRSIKVDGSLTDLFRTQDRIVAALGEALIPGGRSGAAVARRDPRRAVPREAASAGGTGVTGVLDLEDALEDGNGNGNGVRRAAGTPDPRRGRGGGSPRRRWRAGA